LIEQRTELNSFPVSEPPNWAKNQNWPGLRGVQCNRTKYSSIFEKEVCKENGENLITGEMRKGVDLRSEKEEENGERWKQRSELLILPISTTQAFSKVCSSGKL